MTQLFRRHRRTSPALSPGELRTSWQLISLLLDYPSEDLVHRAAALRGALAETPPRVREPLGRFIDTVERTPLRTLQGAYIDTFDVTRRCALHLTYYTCGDTRKRGVELVRLKQAYRDAGAGYDHEELPDHLSVILEFGSFVDTDAAWKILCDNRVGIELLNRALAERGSRWHPLIQALRATLPQLDGTDEEALARLIAEGPPTESVGLDPYALGPDIPVGIQS